MTPKMARDLGLREPGGLAETDKERSQLKGGFDGIVPRVSSGELGQDVGCK